MESIERAIRNAFAKAEAHNPATRQRIYEAAWGAHERALATNTALNAEQKTHRREKLKEAISRIEQEFSPRRETPRQHEPSLDAPDMIDPVLRTADSGAGPVLAAEDIRPAADKSGRGTQPGYDTDTRRRKRSKKRHSPFYTYGIPALVLIVAGMVGYSLYNSFADFTRGSSSPLHADSSLAPVKEGEDPEGREWITIFTPQDAVRVSVQGRAQVEIMNEGNNSFARIQSPATEDTITVDVGEGVLAQLAGKKATFDIVARSEGEESTQMSVSCDFAAMGDCGNRRYNVGDTINDFLFDVEFPVDQKANGAGKIMINSDLEGKGKPVDIYAIRVTAVQAGE
ncbi:hypothetical protein DKP76_07690 [Falsochrobactrum shanghaiense]|uniref:Biotin transporter BioY n=1 Tax=Falsochrobactrum shanghaiense TaxID=2201899 RepID=A0A316JAM0_9HYPH|nr:hypothetical protein [Falsochrobactrum shanghaiense]PWL18922.1 hypothetical protein DKP76_07690 [Falsochrobactrum shanghaiense]